MRKLVTLLAALTALAVPSFVASASSASIPLLPGEALTANGTPAYLFGTNDTIEWGGVGTGFPSSPAEQADLAQGIPGGLVRSWVYSADGSNATPALRYKAMTNAKQACMFNLGAHGGNTIQVSFYEKVVTTYGNSCVYEFNNEPNYGEGMLKYQQQWNTVVPKLKAIDPTIVIGGPAYAGNPGGDGGVVTWLKSTVTHNTVPSFFSWHSYPCEQDPNTAAGQAQCLTDTANTFQQNQQGALAQEQAGLGYTIPTGVSEYNVGAGGTDLEDNGSDCFYYQWQQAAIADAQAYGFALAQQFDIDSSSDYGSLDMFHSGVPRGEFWGMVAAAQADGLSGSTLAIPPSYASCAPIS